MSAELPQLPRVIAVPSDRLWLDPPFVARQLYTQFSNVALPVTGSVLVARANVMRWALGLILAPGSGSGGTVAPWSDVVGGGGIVLTVSQLEWYTLTLHGSLVCGEWYGAGGAGSVVRVVEVIRQ